MTTPPPSKKRKKDVNSEYEAAHSFSVDDKEFQCPICHDIIKEAYITQCGHSFCYFCIIESLKVSSKCPHCSSIISQEKLIPNFHLNVLLSHYKKNEYPFVDRKQTVRQLVDFVKDKKYNLNEITDLLKELDSLKKKQKKEEEEMESEVFLEFLRKTKEEKEISLKLIENDIKFLDEDITRLEHLHVPLKPSPDHHHHNNHNNIHFNFHNGNGNGVKKSEEEMDTEQEENDHNNNINNDNKHQNGDNNHSDGDELCEDGERTPDSPSLAERSKKKRKTVQLKKKKLMECLPNLQSLYFEIKNNNQPKTTSSPNSNNNNNNNTNNSNNNVNNNLHLHSNHFGHYSNLNSFSKSLAKFTTYNSCKKLMTVRFAEPFSSSTIVSSLEFDRDEEYFATAGVNKILRVYEYKNISKSDEISFPRREMPCRSKISSLSWNPYLKSYIASTDYEGRVSIWDTEEGKKIISLEEHNKRAWSVDFSHTNPTTLASGSDDMTVKIWCLNQRKATTTIQGTANVCSVAFNPYVSNEIALGLADHDIKYYDLRFLSKPIHVFTGHKKSVSYVKFLSKSEIVSASTDSTLKLWDIASQDGTCKRTFMGHINEKNFVGLSCNNDYIACGSENNSMYIYYKEISYPAVVHRFSRVEDHNKYFISSICWRKRDNVLLSANSEGGIKIFGVE